jgi:hypothetical protein
MTTPQPSAIPPEVLEKVAYAIYDYTGQSMEDTVPTKYRGAYEAMARAALYAYQLATSMPALDPGLIEE